MFSQLLIDAGGRDPLWTIPGLDMAGGPGLDCVRKVAEHDLENKPVSGIPPESVLQLLLCVPVLALLNDRWRPGNASQTNPLLSKCF